MIVFLKMDNDPELLDLLCDVACKRIKAFTTDEILEMLVNLSSTLSPAVKEVFEVANDEFTERLRDNFDPTRRELFIQPDDLAKIINTMLGYGGQMTDDLKQSLMLYITEEQINYLSYDIMAELAVLYSTKMDEQYQRLFFERTKTKFLKELKHLKGETMYKIL